MRRMIEFVFSFFGIKNASKPVRKSWHKPRAQSLVEFAITLPIILILLSGVVEFGFALNYYLSLLDATREAARFYSDQDIYTRDANGDPSGDDMTFYADTAAMVVSNLDPQILKPLYQGRRILLDPANDDVIIHTYSSSGGTVTMHPSSGPYHLYNNFDPIFADAAAVQNQLTSGAPNAGILIVEVHYNYHMVLGLPWITMFVPDPMVLRAYTIMPNRTAEP